MIIAVNDNNGEKEHNDMLAGVLLDMKIYSAATCHAELNKLMSALFLV